MPEKKDQILIARVTDRIKQALANLAQGDGVSMSAYVEGLIEKDLKRKSAKERQKETIS